MAQGETVALRPDWDAAVSYDLLDRSIEAEPSGARHSSLLVGRDDLLEPLVAAILEPEGRGTVLVSGYRGAGKTTLVVEALHRAQRAWHGRRQAGDRTAPQLMPVVLNVSEVAAALSDRSDDKGDAVSSRLTIDPRRLLIALLRSFANRRDQVKGHRDLEDSIDRLYRKATAAEFRQASDAGRSREDTVTREAELTLKSEDLMKGALLPAGAVAAGLAVIGAGESWWGHLFRALAAAGVVGSVALGFGAVVRRKREEKETSSQRIAMAHDNSLQQLENDLKDLLQQLRLHGFRTVIVIEELDKLDGIGNNQFDDVIRYFKNLFTQAPALFIFVTDKVYYDRVTRAIREARRERTYAVAHTFFTHRLFVGRPGLQDCLKCLAAMLAQDGDRAAVAGIYQPRPRVLDSYRRGDDGRVVPGDGITPLGLMARVLLFRANNHLFDLKNEMRRYVRANGTARMLALDEAAFPEAQRRLAKLQDLLASKYETHRMQDGRPYANEIMLGFLYRVFLDMGTRSELPVEALLPSGMPASEAALLEAEERERIEAAVLELLNDLARGQAIQLKPTGPATAARTLQWQPDLLAQFLPVRIPERHETELVAQLMQVARQMEGLDSTALADPALHAKAMGQAAALIERAEKIAQLEQALGVDDARREQHEAWGLHDHFLGAVAAAAHGLVSARYGFTWSNTMIDNPLQGAGAWLLRLQGVDPGLTQTTGRPLQGIVLLTVGDADSTRANARELLARLVPSGIRRLALVQLLPDLPRVDNERARWEESFASQSQSPPPAVRVGSVVLTAGGKGLPDGSVVPLIDYVAAALLRAMWWAAPPQRARKYHLPDEVARNDALTIAAAIQRKEEANADVLVLAAPPSMLARVWAATQALFEQPPFQDRWPVPLTAQGDTLTVAHEDSRARPLGLNDWLSGVDTPLSTDQLAGLELAVQRTLALPDSVAVVAPVVSDRDTETAVRRMPEAPFSVICGPVEADGFVELSRQTVGLARIGEPSESANEVSPWQGRLTLHWGRRIQASAK